MSEKNDHKIKISRRDFLSISAASAVAVSTTLIATNEVHAQEKAPLSNMVEVHLKINGTPHKLLVDTRTTLLDILREHVHLTGTKKGCNHGACGACTVLIDHRRVNSCLTLAVMVQGKEITTIEGLATGEELHPMQQSFIDNDAFQCGYCTPGQILSAVCCVNEGRTNSKAEIREYMSGNLCRCGAYANIVRAVEDGSKQMKGK